MQCGTGSAWVEYRTPPGFESVTVTNLGQGLSLYVHSAVRMSFWLKVVLRVITEAYLNVFHRSRYSDGQAGMEEIA